MNLLIKHGVVVSGHDSSSKDIRVSGQLIVEISENLTPRKDEEVIDAEGCYVLPGIIDAHTHFRLVSRGGQCTADDFLSGSQSSVYGGVTTVIDFADPIPGKSIAEAVRERCQDAEGQSLVDYALHFVVNNDLDPERLSEVSRLGIRALKIFTTYRDAGYFLPEKKLIQVLRKAKELNLVLTVHAEDDDIIAQSKEYLSRKGPLLPSVHAEARPAEAEEKAIQHLLELNRTIGCPLYFVHVSTAAGCALITEAKKEGQMIWGETCPHYLFLHEDAYAGAQAKRNIMSPPLRTSLDSAGLWIGLENGDLQVIATDHCAYTLEQKEKGQTCLDVLPGIPGVETMLPLVYTGGVRDGKLTMEQMVQLLAENPARIFGLQHRKGKIEVGMDADLVLFNPDKESILTADQLHSGAGYTPFEGAHVWGAVEMTVRRGEILLRDGTLVGGCNGAFVPAI